MDGCAIGFGCESRTGAQGQPRAAVIGAPAPSSSRRRSAREGVRDHPCRKPVPCRVKYTCAAFPARGSDQVRTTVAARPRRVSRGRGPLPCPAASAGRGAEDNPGRPVARGIAPRQGENPHEARPPLQKRAPVALQRECRPCLQCGSDQTLRRVGGMVSLAGHAGIVTRLAPNCAFRPAESERSGHGFTMRNGAGSIPPRPVVTLHAAEAARRYQPLRRRRRPSPPSADRNSAAPAGSGTAE